MGQCTYVRRILMEFGIWTTTLKFGHGKTCALKIKIKIITQMVLVEQKGKEEEDLIPCVRWNFISLR